MNYIQELKERLAELDCYVCVAEHDDITGQQLAKAILGSMNNLDNWESEELTTGYVNQD